MNPEIRKGRNKRRWEEPPPAAGERKISHTKGSDGAKRAAQRPIYGAQGGMVARAEGAFGTCKGAHSTALARDFCASVAYDAYILTILTCKCLARNLRICESFAAAHAAALCGHGRLCHGYTRSGGRSGRCLCAQTSLKFISKCPEITRDIL